jgi:hypothetical protein
MPLLLGEVDMRREITLLLLMLILSVSPAYSNHQTNFDIERLSERSRQAYQKLLTAQVFNLGPVGYVGLTSDEEIALRILLKDRKSIEILESLVNAASPEGKLYGLIGLRLKNKAAYRQALVRLESSAEPPERTSSYGIIDISKVTAEGKVPEEGIVPKGEVVTQSGDLVQRKTWHEMLAAIDAGRYNRLLKRR